MCGPWRLCYLENKVQCIAAADPRNPEIVFAQLTPEEVIGGLRSRRWNEISKTLANFWSQKKL